MSLLLVYHNDNSVKGNTGPGLNTIQGNLRDQDVIYSNTRDQGLGALGLQRRSGKTYTSTGQKWS